MQMADVWLKNCKIAPENRECAIGIEYGKITSFKKVAPVGEENIDLKGAVILPGLIDAHVHLRDPGLTHKEDFRTGTAAAACGGFTTVLDMPNTKPPTNTPKAFQEKLEIAEKKSLVDFGLHAGVDDHSQIKKMAKLKPASLKIFMDLVEKEFLTKTFQEISKIEGQKPLISLHCEDKNIVNKCTTKEREKGNLNPEIYANARPAQAETIALSNILPLAREFGLAIHICHISTKKSVELVNNAKKELINDTRKELINDTRKELINDTRKELMNDTKKKPRDNVKNGDFRVTSEITPHHLLLDSSYLKKFGTLAKTNPPLRDRENKIGMKNIAKIDIIGSDHAPHTLKEKGKDVWDAPPGIPNLEVTLPLLLTKINEKKMSFTDLKRLLCKNPSKIFGIKSKGVIGKGMDADFVVVDMKREGIINPDNFKSKAKYSPFEGFKVKGMPVMTLVRGKVVMEEGEVFENRGKSV
jgi:dihydroorotase